MLAWPLPSRVILGVALPLAPLQAQGPAEHARQSYVIERLHRNIRFENDGTSRGTIALRVRIQSPAALRFFGQLTFGYASGNQRLDVDRVVVRKANGDTITAPASAIQDLTGPVAQHAPMYSDLRQKVVTVPGVQAGDTLEYHITWTTHTPYAPGHFWDREEFTRAAIVLDERLSYDVPRHAQTQVKTDGGPAPKVSESGDRRVYEWQRSNLVIDTTDAEKHHGIQLTTFRSWEDVGAWYAALERDRETVTPEIRQRAEQLVRGRTTQRDSIAALYDYVSTQFRYVSLQFGLGRYQPHNAAEVLANQYGDCKDKHVLLAALLRAVGLSSAPALISFGEGVDPDVPSPMQFNHLITFVESGRDTIWLDATPSVAPFGFLLFNLRGKQALVMPEREAAALAWTPADGPFRTYTTTDVTGTLSDAGRLTLSVTYAARGDVEVLLREVFRQVTEDSWTGMAQGLARQLNLTGTVSNPKPSDPIDTRQPFTFEFEVEQPGAADWSNQRAEFTVPLPDVEVLKGTDSLPANDTLPIGIIEDQRTRLRLVLPPGVIVRIPSAVTLTRDYGTYSSSAERRGDTLLVERTLRFEKRFLPPGRSTDVASFRQVVDEDQNRRLVFTRATPVPSVATNASADDLHRVAMAALDAGNARAAVQGFRRVTELEPRHQWAWNNLGRAYLQLGKLDSAELALRRQIEINPFDHYAHNNLGLALRRAGRREDAVAAFRKQIEVNPLDEFAHANLGRLLADMRRDSAAVVALEQAVSIAPDDTALYVVLGNAYLRLRRGADAIAAFNRALALSPSPDMWNNVAYALAEQRTELDTAEAYVRRAIDAVAAQLRDVTAEEATFRETVAVGRLGNYWDTLGWIYFARGDLKNAERYVRAAWLLNYHSAVGEHLGQIEQRLGRSRDAIHTYTLALHAPMPSKTIRPRLVKLLGGSEREADRRIELARNEFTTIRTVKLTGGVAADISGEVQIVLVPSAADSSRARATGVHVTRGPAQLARLKTPLRAAHFRIAFPAADPASLVVRAVVSCSSGGQCAAVLMPAAVLPVPGAHFLEGTVIERLP